MKVSEHLPLYIIHGWGFDCAVLQNLVDELQESFNIRLINLPGYAGQPQVSEYTLPNLTHIIAKKITQPSIIMGWSMGGLIALDLAKNYPEKIHSLVLLCSTPCFAKKSGWDCAMPTNVLNNFISGYNSQPLETMDKFTFLLTEGSQDPRNWIRELKKRSSGKVEQQALEGGLQILLETDLRADLAQLLLPISMIFGEKDSLVPAQVAKEIRAINPLIKTEMIANAGHTPFLSHPEHLAQIIQQHHSATCRN